MQLRNLWELCPSISSEHKKPDGTEFPAAASWMRQVLKQPTEQLFMLPNDEHNVCLTGDESSLINHRKPNKKLVQKNRNKKTMSLLYRWQKNFEMWVKCRSNSSTELDHCLNAGRKHVTTARTLQSTFQSDHHAVINKSGSPKCNLVETYVTRGGCRNLT